MTHWWLNNTLVKQPIHDYSARPTYVLTISVTGQLKPKLMAHSWHQPIHDICILTIPVTGRLKPKLMTHSWLVTMCMWPEVLLACTNKTLKTLECSVHIIFIGLNSIVAVNRYAVRWECWTPYQFLGPKKVCPFQRLKPVDAFDVRAAFFSNSPEITLWVEIFVWIISIHVL